jgi:hypothetical protein
MVSRSSKVPKGRSFVSPNSPDCSRSRTKRSGVQRNKVILSVKRMASNATRAFVESNSVAPTDQPVLNAEYMMVGDGDLPTQESTGGVDPRSSSSASYPLFRSRTAHSDSARLIASCAALMLSSERCAGAANIDVVPLQKGSGMSASILEYLAI